MNDTAKKYPALEAAIEASADCVRLYNAAADLLAEEATWRAFFQQMALRRETLLHRLRFVADRPVERQETDDLVTLRGKLGELALSVMGLFGDQIRMALQSLEPAETRLVERLGEIGVAIADPNELAEMFEAVTVERDALRNLLAGMDAEVPGPASAEHRPQ